MVELDFEFSRLDAEDRSRALFIGPPYKRPSELMREREIRSLMGESESLCAFLQRRLDEQVRKQTHDTYVPGLRVGINAVSDTLELSCDWKGMFSEFFREEKEYAHIP